MTCTSRHDRAEELTELNLRLNIRPSFSLRDFLNARGWSARLKLSEISGSFELDYPSLAFDELIAFATGDHSFSVSFARPVVSCEEEFSWFAADVRNTISLTNSEWEHWRRQLEQATRRDIDNGLHIVCLDKFKIGKVAKKRCDVFGPAAGGPYRLFCDSKFRQALEVAGMQAIDYLPLLGLLIPASQAP